MIIESVGFVFVLKAMEKQMKAEGRDVEVEPLCRTLIALQGY